MKRLLLLLTFVASFAHGSVPVREEPVGLVLSAAGGKVLRAGTETAIAARAGDILFAGDALRSESTPAAFLYCPAKSSQTLEPSGEVLLDARQLKVKAGKLGAAKPVNACFLPQVVRVAVASQQHYGVSMTRGLAKPEGDVVAFQSLPAGVRNELAVFEQALTQDPRDAQALVEEAAVFERSHLEANALAQYRRAAAVWQDAVWVRGRIFELEESLATAAALKAAAISPDAKTYAMLIGVSRYQKLPKDLWLQYPDADATAFSQHLASAKGGAVPADRMMVLTDEQATTAALRNAFQTFLKTRPGRRDTVFILLAGHGAVDARGSYILTWDSDPQDLSATALPMAEIQKLVEDELSKVGRVVLLADVCRAASIGSLKNNSIGSAIEKLGEAPGEMLGLMASRPKETGLEGSQFGGGHGAFTYSLLNALEGSADSNRDKTVTAGELIDYVRSNVSTLTGNKQHPRDFGSIENATRLADVSAAGVNISRFKSLYDSRSGGPLFIASAADAPVLPQAAQRDVDEFNAALAAGRLLPSASGSAWDYIPKLRAELQPETMLLHENALRVALENKAQQVLLRYLAGDQSPQTKAEFRAGSEYMEAAMRLTPESLWLQGRDAFFAGRAMLFEKNFAGASDLLERAVRIDPGEAYGYNALGIAYLEQAQFDKAIPAFRDAAKRAPGWSYPLHNLALAYVEAGDAEGAIRSYREAMRITPQFSYLPYNLGLVYQRLNRQRDAELAYRQAASLDPASAEPLNALGSLKASGGKAAEAEKLYKEALAKDPSLLAARHNLAILLEGQKSRQPEALDLLRRNIELQPDFLPSRIELAEALARSGDAQNAAAQFREVIARRPDYAAARIALAAQLNRSGQASEALVQLRAAAKIVGGDPSVWEQIGDAERALNHPTESHAAYATAMQLQAEKAGRKRLRAKLEF